MLNKVYFQEKINISLNKMSQCLYDAQGKYTCTNVIESFTTQQCTYVPGTDKLQRKNAEEICNKRCKNSGYKNYNGSWQGDTNHRTNIYISRCMCCDKK